MGVSVLGFVASTERTRGPHVAPSMCDEAGGLDLTSTHPNHCATVIANWHCTRIVALLQADIGGKGSSGLACGLIDFASYTGSIIFFFLKPLLSTEVRRRPSVFVHLCLVVSSRACLCLPLSAVVCLCIQSRSLAPTELGVLLSASSGCAPGVSNTRC